MPLVAAFILAAPGVAVAQTPTPTATAAPSGPQPGRTVTLGLWYVTTDQPTAPAGNVRFNVTNAAGGGHELAVIRTNLLANALPQTAGTGRVNETGLDVVGRVALAGGATGNLTLDLTPGMYALICNLPRGTTNGHYASGMFTSLEVRATGAAPLGNAAPVATAAPAQATQATPTPAAAGGAAPAAPKTGSGGMLVSDVAGGAVLALLLATVAVVAGGRVLAGRAR